MKRIDKTEYEIAAVLDQRFGYYNDEIHAKRAIAWMKEGWIKDNPRSNWSQSGWKLTAKGKKHVAEVIAEVRKKHGHVWASHRDIDPESYKNDKYGKSIDWFALEGGYHNGPRCKKCGFEFCHHCKSEWEIPHCPSR